MNLLDLTLPTPQENLACDEALLDGCDSGTGPEVLRFWEPREPFVVVGYSNRVSREVNANACAGRAIPILRRSSGGGTVVQGPGCLNYALVLQFDGAPPLQGISETNAYVLQRHHAALATLTPGSITVEGHSDLALDGLKFSGNAQRRKRRALLFHGTFLLRFDLSLVEQLLPHPSRTPPYRRDRPHREFLCCFNAAPSDVRDALRTQWQARQPLQEIPLDSIRQLAREKYSNPEWNFRLV